MPRKPPSRSRIRLPKPTTLRRKSAAWSFVLAYVGDVMVKDGDIFGDGVNIAARLEALAEPGGICVSRGVRDHIRHKLAVAFEDLGEQRVKNIARPIRAFQLRLNGGTGFSEAEEDSAPEPPQARRGRGRVLGQHQTEHPSARISRLS
jgi:hypothetical protein